MIPISEILELTYYKNLEYAQNIWVVIAAALCVFIIHKNSILRFLLFTFLLSYFGYMFASVSSWISGKKDWSASDSLIGVLFYPIPAIIFQIIDDWLFLLEYTIPFISLVGYILALYFIGSSARAYEWWRLRTLLTRGPQALQRQSAGTAVSRPTPASPAPAAAVGEDDEEREIALASRRVEQAEQAAYREAPVVNSSPAPAAPVIDDGPSWWERQRERREVERARREMEQAEREAARPSQPPHPAYAGYPYPYPPPYAPPKRPLSEWFKTAYWGTRILILVVVAVWMVFASSSLLGAAFALVPRPLLDLGAEFVIKLGEAMKGGQ